MVAGCFFLIIKKGEIATPACADTGSRLSALLLLTGGLSPLEPERLELLDALGREGTSFIVSALVTYPFSELRVFGPFRRHVAVPALVFKSNQIGEASFP